jgi:20S proteasome subunit beta 4
MHTGDTVQFAEFVERNIRLYQIRNLYPLRPAAAASWIRRSLADSIRSRKPYSVNLLLGGYDTADEKPRLYWIDYLGTMTEVPFGAHGYGSYFALALLDKCVCLPSYLSPLLIYRLNENSRYHNPDATLEEGLETLKRCIDQVAKRLIVNPGSYKVKVVDKDGVREVEL